LLALTHRRYAGTLGVREEAVHAVVSWFARCFCVIARRTCLHPGRLETDLAEEQLGSLGVCVICASVRRSRSVVYDASMDRLVQ
jgi:hypothetical protein